MRRAPPSPVAAGLFAFAAVAACGLALLFMWLIVLGWPVLLAAGRAALGG